MSTLQEILLASASARRGELLQQLGVGFQQINHLVTEQRLARECAEDYVRRMALEKAHSALAQYKGDQDRVVLAADTSVVCDEETLGKPEDESDAIAMLSQLSNREHRVLSAVTVGTVESLETAMSESTVRFRAITPREMKAYWRTGEPLGKAGAYAIQGIAAVFVEKMVGSYSGVMGLPLFETAQLLQRYSINCWLPGTACLDE